MGDAGVREEGPEMVEDGLVRDLSRQPDVSRRDPSYGRAHKGAPPMGGRPGDVGDAVRAGSDQEVRGRLLGAGQHHRASAEERAQEDLQAAIPSDVVERAPHGRVARRPPAAHRSREARQRVHDHLRPARRPGRQEDPFRLVSFRPLAGCRRDLRGARNDGSNPWSPTAGCRLIGHECIHRRRRRHEWQMLGRQIGRAENESARDGIELDEGQRRRELIPGRDEY